MVKQRRVEVMKVEVVVRSEEDWIVLVGKVQQQLQGCVVTVEEEDD